MTRRDEIAERLRMANSVGLDEVVARHYREDVPWLLAEVDKWQARADGQANLAMNLQARIEAVRELLKGE